METWALDFQPGDGNAESTARSYILRRLPYRKSSPAKENESDNFGQLSLATEAELLSGLSPFDIKAPKVITKLPADGTLGVGYLMTLEPGETSPKKILNGAQYATARQRLSYECGQQLAKIHAVPLNAVPDQITDLTTAQRLQHFQDLNDRFANPSPVHQLAINWLLENQATSETRTLLHGDFRNGNLLVTETGLSAVLDWELAHIGYPSEDLASLCSNVWRFGKPQNPVGGFGHYGDLLDGYESIAGWKPDVVMLKYWEVFSALSWGCVCLLMESIYHSGFDRSLERLAIGRRFCESEVDILLLLDELGALQPCDRLEGSDLPGQNDEAATEYKASCFQSTDALLSAVHGFLNDQVVPELQGYSKYTTRVAANSILIALRDQAMHTDVVDLDSSLGEELGLPKTDRTITNISLAIKSKGTDIAAPIIRKLKQRTLVQLAINNPKYWGYSEAKKKW